MRSAHGSHRVPAERAASTYVGHRELFSRPCTEHKGYSDLYFARLNQLAPRVKTAVAERWGAAALEQQVKTLDAECDVAAVVIGTLYKDMSGKPSIVDELNAMLEQQAEAATPGTRSTKGYQCSLRTTRDDWRSAVAQRYTVLNSGAVCGGGKLNEAGGSTSRTFASRPLAAAQLSQWPTARRTEQRFVALVSACMGHGAQDMLHCNCLPSISLASLGATRPSPSGKDRVCIAGNATAVAEVAGIVGTQPDDP